MTADIVCAMRNNLCASIASLLTIAAFASVPSRARAADDAELIAPYVAERTIAVVRIDAEKVSLTKLAVWYIDSMKRANAPADLIQGMEMQLKMGAAMAQQQFDKVKQAGVKNVLLVVNLDERDQLHPIFIAPAVANMEQFKQVVQPLQLSVIKSDGDFIATDRRYAEKLADLKPAKRDELVSGLANADSAITISAALPESFRAKLAVDYPTIQTSDDEIESQVLLDGIRHALVKIDIQPTLGIHYTVQSSDEAAAKALKDLISAQTEKQAAHPELASVVGLLRSVAPAQQGSKLTLELKEADLDKLVAESVPAMLKAREAANRVKSASNIRQLMMASIMFTNENKGQTPATLKDLEKLLGGPVALAAILTNPLRPELRQEGYVLVPALEGQIVKVKDPSNRLAVYEAGDFGQGINVGFWDGHVEWIADKARFDQLLATAQGK